MLFFNLIKSNNLTKSERNLNLNSPINLNDIWHTERETEYDLNNKNQGNENIDLNLNYESNKFSKNSSMHITWTNLNVSLPKKRNFLQKINFLKKKHSPNASKKIIENGNF